ncbi:MAG: MBOAT family O-acyltransferase [Acidobacteriota bacterium]
MLFNTLHFLGFLLTVLAVFYALPLSLRRFWLLAASYYFYASWNLKFLALLISVTLVDFAAGLLIARASAPSRRLWLIASIAVNLSVLVFFKYFHFLTESLLGRRFPLEIILPIGISFHIFQSLSYVIDVYRRQQAPIRNPLDYALFLAFFPQLVAGPIVRAHNFFADLNPWRKPTPEDLSRGVFLLALGLTKKMAFADNFARLSDSYFGALSAHPGVLDAWSGALAFSLQIFFDFSGYTDLAIGMAKLLGFHFPINFRRPYLAGSLTEFWRRWHISLSSWLRDYLYIPLGGNRHGRARTYLNLMLTMLLGGLWHGASFNFILWGGWHGLLLAFERATSLDAPRWYRIPLTFLLVLHGWVLFRAPSLLDSFFVLEHLWRGPLGAWLFTPWQTGLALLAALLAWAEERFGLEDRLVAAPALPYALSLAIMLLICEIFAVTDVEIPFVYFQF